MVQRMTRQRTAITDLMKGTNAFKSAQEIHDMLAAEGSAIGLATVYRNLQTMAESGLVDVIRPGDSETAYYRYCADDHHHHHLICRRCSTTVELKTDMLESWADKVAAEHGFTQTSHSLEVWGLCSTCSGKLANA
ncbi:Fur family transcriptional regulator [Arcanobacterium canis]